MALYKALKILCCSSHGRVDHFRPALAQRWTTVRTCNRLVLCGATGNQHDSPTGYAYKKKTSYVQSKWVDSKARSPHVNKPVFPSFHYSSVFAKLRTNTAVLSNSWPQTQEKSPTSWPCCTSILSQMVQHQTFCIGACWNHQKEGFFLCRGSDVCAIGSLSCWVLAPFTSSLSKANIRALTGPQSKGWQPLGMLSSASLLHESQRYKKRRLRLKRASQPALRIPQIAETLRLAGMAPGRWEHSALCPTLLSHRSKSAPGESLAFHQRRIWLVHVPSYSWMKFQEKVFVYRVTELLNQPINLPEVLC